MQLSPAVNSILVKCMFLLYQVILLHGSFQALVSGCVVLNSFILRGVSNIVSVVYVSFFI